MFLSIDILENLTAVADNLTALTTPPASGQKRKCSWETFEDEDKENSAKSNGLRGIKLQNASFNPQFPEIVPGDVSAVVFETSQQSSDQQAASVDGEGNESLLHDVAVWKNFTAILEAKSPLRPNNFSSNFSTWQIPQTPVTFSTFGKNVVTPSSDAVKRRASKKADLSDTPFLDQVVVASTSAFQRPNVSDALVTSDCSVSSSSASVNTPERLRDLHFVNQRLITLTKGKKVGAVQMGD